MGLDVLYRYGACHADKGTGWVRRTPHLSGTLPHLDTPVAGLLAEGISPCRHGGIYSARRPLVCGHAPRTWRGLCHSRESPYSRPIPQSDGGTPGHHLLLFPGPAPRLLSLECVPSCPTLPHSQRVVPHTPCAYSSRPRRRIRTRPFCSPLAGGNLCILHGLCDPPPPLYWPIVSRRRPVDSLVLVPVHTRSDDERDSGIHTSHDGSGISLGHRLCLPSYALHNLRIQDGAGVPL